MSIDTIRLRALHTKCLPVCEIADKLGITPTAVEIELERLGLKPHDPTDFMVEPNEIIAEHNKKKENESEGIKEEPAPASTDTSSEKNNFGKVYDNIIPENPEPVNRFSAATLAAIDESISRKKNEIERLEQKIFAKYQAIEKINEKISKIENEIAKLYDDVRQMEADKGAMI